MPLRIRCLVLSVVQVVLLSSYAHSQLDQELVVNGGGETGDLTGWVSGGIEPASPPDPMSAGFGSYVFWGSTGTTTQTAQQIIDVAPVGAQIDQGTVYCCFGVQLQARQVETVLDTSEAQITFRDSSGGSLESYLLADTDPAALDWDFYGDTRLVPIGTTSIELLLRCTRNGGASTDGFMDDASLRLTLDPVKFRRGDSNSDILVDISDAVYSLEYLFSGGLQPGCARAADANDDGAVDISDPAFTLNWLFSGGPPPPAPGPGACGPDPTPDLLTCDSPTCV